MTPRRYDHIDRLTRMIRLRGAAGRERRQTQLMVAIMAAVVLINWFLM